jgi:hypothetical protein
VNGLKRKYDVDRLPFIKRKESQGYYREEWHGMSDIIERRIRMKLTGKLAQVHLVN